MVNMLDVEDDGLCEQIVLTLGKCAEQADEATPALLRMLDRRDGQLRAVTVSTLGKMRSGAMNSLPKLRVIARTDPDPYVREQAGAAVQTIEAASRR